MYLLTEDVHTAMSFVVRVRWTGTGDLTRAVVNRSRLSRVVLLRALHRLQLLLLSPQTKNKLWGYYRGRINDRSNNVNTNCFGSLLQNVIRIFKINFSFLTFFSLEIKSFRRDNYIIIFAVIQPSCFSRSYKSVGD